MNSPIELLFDHFSVSTILAIIVLTNIDSPSTSKIGSLLVLIVTLSMLFCTHYAEYDIYNYLRNRTLNYNIIPIIFSIIIIGSSTLFFYKSGDLFTFKVSMIAFIWNLILSIVWLILKNNKEKKPKL